MPATAIALPPLLREGDRLDSAEFLRRWEAMPALRNAELISGIVYMPSPVMPPHAKFHSAMDAWAWLYQDATLGCESGTECTWRWAPKIFHNPTFIFAFFPNMGANPAWSPTTPRALRN